MFASPNQDLVNTHGDVNTMAGTTVSREQFTHNNMEPYFAGSAKQNTNGDNHRLQTFTGNFSSDDGVWKKKQEVACFFEPTGNMGNPCGFMENNDDFYKSRNISSKAQNNVFPIDQVHVGKGLGLGYTDAPAGGFQQANTRDFMMPKNVDELRVATNPRMTYNLPVNEAKTGIYQRPILPNIDKNRPERFYEQSQDQLLKTTGAVKREMTRPIQDVKATARVDTHVTYGGPTQTSSTKPGKGTKDNYGKDTVTVCTTARELTGQSSIISNFNNLSA
jgi:hypothetical protein